MTEVTHPFAATFHEVLRRSGSRTLSLASLFQFFQLEVEPAKRTTRFEGEFCRRAAGQDLQHLKLVQCDLMHSSPGGTVVFFAIMGAHKKLEGLTLDLSASCVLPEGLASAREALLALLRAASKALRQLAGAGNSPYLGLVRPERLCKEQCLCEESVNVLQTDLGFLRGKRA